MSEISSVPVVDVTEENVASIWPSLILAVKTSLYVAIDLELSGIGGRKEINAKSVEDRYSAVSRVADTRAIISIGLSCFRHDSRSSVTGSLKFTVQTFNILVLCKENYIVEPSSLQFLISHGFDFNRQYSLGVPYYRGNDRPNEANEDGGVSLRTLFLQLLLWRKPIVLHNGLLDLAFLYHSFYLALPAKLPSFLADLTEMFPSGVYDTKYISETRAALQASYLEYVFRKRQRDNASREAEGKSFVSIQFLQYNKEHSVDHGNCALRTERLDVQLEICKNFARFGWCAKGDQCRGSHSVDDVLDAENAKRRKRKRGKKNGATISSNASSDSEASTKETPCDVTTVDENGAAVTSADRRYTTGLHRAGYDAFMTGYAFATFLLEYAKCRPGPSGGLDANDAGLEGLVNRVYLTGKTDPLQIRVGNFARHSAKHVEKYNALFGNK